MPVPPRPGLPGHAGKTGNSRFASTDRTVRYPLPNSPCHTPLRPIWSGGVDAYVCDFACGPEMLVDGSRVFLIREPGDIRLSGKTRSAGLAFSPAPESRLERATRRGGMKRRRLRAPLYSPRRISGSRNTAYPGYRASCRTVRSPLLFNCTTARPQCGITRTRSHGEKYVVLASASDIRNASIAAGL